LPSLVSLQGASIVSWVGIDEEGNTIELKAPAPSSPSSDPVPDTATASAAPVGGALDAHPRCFRVEGKHKGWAFKFRVQPVRSDGDEGHMESSRPTKDVE
jgi:hypothetical protein